MTTMSEEPSKLDEATLQSEAAAVERLRRHIAELPSKGEVATPQLLAQFAVAQKRYLDRKIEFEKQRRSGAPASDVRGTTASKAPATPAPAPKPEPKVPVKAEKLPVPAPAKPEVPTNAPAKADIPKKAPVAEVSKPAPAPAKVPVPEITKGTERKPLPIGLIIAGIAIVLAIAAWLLVKK